jgi:hypothetical protein
MGMSPARVRTAEGAVEVAVLQVRGGEQPFRSSLMGFLDGNRPPGSFQRKTIDLHRLRRSEGLIDIVRVGCAKVGRNTVTCANGKIVGILALTAGRP